MRRRAPVAST
ncbi:hypothetical protein E2C01_076389 [Portunus trituberculatus]|uniref:Uncharacterized protein n=1 Tax=Portunus trituberculatus TaxID=210409 RepID=A0A5B7IIF0_PORTR|nr:hypothetical protein [Portunus trituberculatus]